MNILKNRKIYLSISVVLFVFSIVLLFVGKLNLGIDLTGWTQAEYEYTNTINIEDIKQEINEEKEAMRFYCDEKIREVHL